LEVVQPKPLLELGQSFCNRMLRARPASSPAVPTLPKLRQNLPQRLWREEFCLSSHPFRDKASSAKVAQSPARLPEKTMSQNPPTPSHVLRLRSRIEKFRRNSISFCDKHKLSATTTLPFVTSPRKMRHYPNISRRLDKLCLRICRLRCIVEPRCDISVSIRNRRRGLLATAPEDETESN
jgi:hypothetical protein